MKKSVILIIVLFVVALIVGISLFFGLQVNLEKMCIRDSAYTLVSPDDASSKQIKEVPALENEPVYFLDTDLSKEKLDQLDQDLTLSLIHILQMPIFTWRKS